MDSKEKKAIIKRLRTKDKRLKIYHSDIPEEYQEDKDVINEERKNGMRKIDRIGFDVINQVYFVHELVLDYNEFNQEEIWRESLRNFFYFDDYYNYLNGEIYDNACYYQCDLSVIKKKVDKSRMSEHNSFVKDSIDNYSFDLSEDEIIKYKNNENNKLLCKKWIEKYKNISSCAELIEAENSFRKSKLFKDLRTEETRFFFGLYHNFMLWNFISEAKNDKAKFKILMEYMSRITCAGTLVREICGILNPDDVVKNYNFTDSSKQGIYKQKKRLKDIADAIKNNRVDINVSGFFDEKTHYYCEKTMFTLLDEKVWRSEGMREFSNYRFFESFDEFIEYRDGDLSNVDLKNDIQLNYDFSKCKTNENTKLPIKNANELEYVIKKKYLNGKFGVLQAWYDNNKALVKHYIHTFDYFFDFVAFLKGDLSGADLLFCEGLKNLSDVSDIDFTDSIIISSICDKFGIKYKNYFIDSSKMESFSETEECEKSTEIILQTSRELIISEETGVLGLPRYDPTKERVSYVSDLHLVHKLLKNFNTKSKFDVIYIIQNIVNNIVDETESMLLIGGDVSSEISIFEMFIRLLRDELNRERKNTKVIFVLGNHELWGFPTFEFDMIVEKYEKLITECGMYLLQNNILYKDSEQEIHRISDSELKFSSKKDIRNRLRDARIVLFGGLAFSGYEEEFNANKGIYRETICRSEEIEQSKYFEELYNRVVSLLPDKRIVIFTHTPMNCWYKKTNYHRDYVYVSGHTHMNQFYDDGEIRIYADNQIGYFNNNPHLKWFDMDNDYDYFSDYEDGIYNISADDYRQFYRGKNITITFNREVNILYMLKKNGYYCFIHKSEGGSLTILNGGSLKKLHKYDINYYYNNMDAVIAMIKEPFDKYTSIQEKISSEIRKLGGDGTIHGCIVDIDFHNHIYINPVDLKITGYWASDIINKKIYTNVPTLLEKECPLMYERYKKLLKDSSNNLSIFANGAETDISVLPQIYFDTDIYKASREMKKMQKLNSNILTMWYEVDDGIKRIE